MLKINNYDLYTNKNKKFNILFLSDLHFSSKFKLADDIIDKAKKEKPNYICITGDIVDTTQILDEEEKRVKNFFKELEKISKILIVLGNHDLQNMRKHMNNFNGRMLKWKLFFSDLKNVYLLDNSYFKDSNINVLGITLSHDYYYKKPFESENELNKILKKIKPSFNNDTYNIVMLHSPEKIFYDKNIKLISKSDLVLCGHMHDGIVPKILKKLPTSRGLISPHRTLFPKYARGMIIKNIDNHDIRMLVSGGVTKIGPYLPKILHLFDILYDNEMEKLKIRGKNE